MAELSAATAVHLSTDWWMGEFVLATKDREELEKQKGRILKDASAADEGRGRRAEGRALITKQLGI